MTETLLTLEEVEKAVFEALDNVRIYDQSWEIDEEEIREMPSHKDVIGAFELWPTSTTFVH